MVISTAKPNGIKSDFIYLIIPSVSISVICLILFVYPMGVDALIAVGGFLPSLTMTVGFVQLFLTISLFLLIPVTLFGIILRLIGFKKEPVSGDWHWNLKIAVGRFVKYFSYHTGMLSIWFIMLYNLDGTYRLALSRKATLFDESLVLIQKHYIIFLIYIELWALLCPYIYYWWNQQRKKPTYKPTLGVFIRLSVWNAVIFLSSGILIHWIFLLDAFKF